MMRCLVQCENRDRSAAGRDLRAGDDARVQVDIGKEESVERKKSPGPVFAGNTS